MLATRDPVEEFFTTLVRTFRRPKPVRPDPPKIVVRTVLSPSPTRRTSKQAALSDLLDRLGNGETIPSQDALAAVWNRKKQTVSDWMREWRRIGVIPSETRVGRCKATVPC